VVVGPVAGSHGDLRLELVEEGGVVAQVSGDDLGDVDEGDVVGEGVVGQEVLEVVLLEDVFVGSEDQDLSVYESVEMLFDGLRSCGPGFDLVQSHDMALGLILLEEVELLVDGLVSGLELLDGVFGELFSFGEVGFQLQELELGLLVAGAVDDVGWGADFFDELGEDEVRLVGGPGVEEDVVGLLELLEQVLEVLAVVGEGELLDGGAVFVLEDVFLLDFGFEGGPVDDFGGVSSLEVCGDGLGVDFGLRTDDEAPVASGDEVLVEGVEEFVVDIDELASGVQS
jgi:hypothetical protein